jgi:hypothetical protein
MMHLTHKRTYLLAQVIQKLSRRFRLELISRRELDFKPLFKRPNHVIPLPRALKVHQLGLTILPIGVVRYRLSTSKLDDKVGDQLFGHLHDVVHICIGHVKLAQRELRIVRRVDPLVAEDTANFVHSVEPTYYELLERELVSDTQIEVEVEVVVMRYEWLRGCACRDHVHGRRFDLENC